MAFTAKLENYPGSDKDVIILRSEHYRAEIAPFDGSNLIQMWDVVSQVPFFRDTEGVTAEALRESAEVYGLPTLLFPNRLRDGVMHCSDASYQFPITDIPERCSMHGFLQRREHAILECAADGKRAVARTSYLYDESDPFFPIFPVKLQADYRFTLNEEGLEYAFTVTNLSERQLPYGVCMHAAFRGDAESTRLFASVDERCKLDDRHLPIGKNRPLKGDELLLLTGEKDPIYAGMDSEAYTAKAQPYGGEVLRGAVIRNIQTGHEIVYRVDDNFRFWVLWNDGGNQGFFCPEPSTWQIDAPNLNGTLEQTGYLELKPGESKTVHQWLSVIHKKL